MIASFIAILARAGGGGSSSGGGSFGGGFSSGAGYAGVAAGSSATNDASFWPFFIIFIAFLIVYFIVTRYLKARGLSNTTMPSNYIDAQSDKSATDEQKKLSADATDLFMTFQQAWSKNDIKKIKAIVSEDYYKRMVLELNVLKNYGRVNIMDEVRVLSAGISQQENYKQGFDMFFTATANDQLLDNSEDRVIFADNSTFSETWHFTRQGKKFVLNGISQETEDMSKYNAEIAEFAMQNGFYYDPDFGWLMMPTRGAIFGPAGFGSADINNHVIGYYKQKIVEFYSYEPRAGQGIKPMVVAQAILPKRYDDILVTEKSWYKFKPKMKGLEKVETESNDFNKKFAVWAARPDRATSFELLATNFMERIYKQKFEINIEVVDNVLYLYSPDTSIDYAEMLEVLSWAFEEMKL